MHVDLLFIVQRNHKSIKFIQIIFLPFIRDFVKTIWINMNKIMNRLDKIHYQLARYPWLYYWFPLIFICGLIFYLSHQPELPEPPIEMPFLDKIEHIGIYTVLGYCARRAFDRGNTSFLSRIPGICTVLFCLLYGISDEFHQSFIPTRESNNWDILADVLGGILGNVIHSKKLIQMMIQRFL